MHPARTALLRRWYFFSLFLGLSVVVLLRLFAFDGLPTNDFTTMLASVADNLTAAILAAIAVGALLPLLFPQQDEKVAIGVLDASAIAQAIESSTHEAREWSVRARTATYFTRETLPALTRAALKHKRPIRIRMQMLDPEVPALMDAYARLRSNHPGAAAKWTPEKVRIEIYSSILLAGLSKKEAPRLEIRVGLSPMNWVMSLDISDQIALVTGQNKGEPALSFERSSTFFSGWCDEFESAFDCCRQLVPTPPELTPSQIKRPTPAHLELLRDYFNGMGLESCDDFGMLRRVCAETAAAHHYE